MSTPTHNENANFLRELADRADKRPGMSTAQLRTLLIPAVVGQRENPRHIR